MKNKQVKVDGFEKALSRIKEDAKCRDHEVNKEHPNWVSTDEIAEKIAAEYKDIETPWLEVEHRHGVSSVVTGVCKKHKMLIPMLLGNLWRGTTLYGCPECAWEKGHEFAGHEEFNIKRNRPNYIGQSKAEFNLFCAIKEHFPDALAHHRMQGGKEIDIWIPSIGCGVEYNGSYWHSNVMGKDKDYHGNKSRIANKQGKGIFHLFPSEAEDVDRIVRMLKLLGYAKQEGHNEYKVPSKAQLGVKPIMSAQAKEFHQKWNFINLKDAILDIHVGVFFEGEMIGAVSGNSSQGGLCKMSFSKAFFDFASLLKMVNKIYDNHFAYVVDIRNPLEYGLIDTSLGRELLIGKSFTPMVIPLDSRYEFLPRQMLKLEDMLKDPEKFDGEVARTWDCGHIIACLPKQVPHWFKKADLSNLKR